MTEPVLRALGAWKSYDGRTDVLRGVDLDVLPGEAVTIVGDNGSGKTTLLNVLGGMDRPDRGRVEVRGREITTLSERELARVRLRDIGFVFQDHNLIEDLTVRENLALPLRLAGVRDETRIDELVSAFGLRELTGRRPEEISVGESQRIAVARALANGPSVVLADEPFAALDRRHVGTVREAFELARERFRVSLVVAQHDAGADPGVGTAFRLVDGRLRPYPGRGGRAP